MKSGVVALVFSLAATASDFRELQWADLVPETAVVENPFSALTPRQMRNLNTLARMRDLQANDEPVADEDIRDAHAAMVQLKRDGIDAMAMLADAENLYQQRKQQDAAVNEQLDGVAVRIPGYLLPLEFDGTRVTEFLLVPYVGACIHVPPPPPNQIVLVTSSQGLESTGLFTPVWVNGAMRTETKTSQLDLIDGTSDIAAGYVMEASQIELYAQ